MFKVSIEDQERRIVFEVQAPVESSLCVSIESLDEPDLTSSNRYKTKLQSITRQLYSEFRHQARTYIRAILHNTTNTEILIRQTIERYTRRIAYNTTYAEKVDAFTQIIMENPAEFAKDLLFLEQRAIDLDAQLIGMNLLIGRPYEPEPAKNPLKPLLWRCLQPFIEILKANSVNIDFSSIEDGVYLTADFRLFNCAMYHFFDNIQKYIKPDSDLYVFLDPNKEVINFSMISRALDEEEKTKIFDESYSGRNSGSQKGEGFGMYIFKRVLKEMYAIPSVDWQEEALVPFEGNSYRKQIFSINFPPGVIYE